MMNILVSTLPKGGFDDSSRALYVLLMNEYVYAGITGTSNNTGLSSPHKRLGAHVYKRGKTKSAVWDNVLNTGLVSKEQLAVRMVTVYVDEEHDAARIERLVIHTLQDRIDRSLLLNNRVRTLPSDASEDERNMAHDFVDKVLLERQRWMNTQYGEAPATPSTA